MRHVHFPLLGHDVSALGFGTASLGSRISPAIGRAAIERALEAGVAWFDTAPSYGDGLSEVILGEALGARAKDVAIVTKVGLVANPPSAMKKLVGDVARPIVAALPALRSLAKRARPDVARRLPLTGALVRDSLARSLDRLKVDRVAVLALHEPSLEDVRNPDVAAALVEARDAGRIGAIGIAGELSVYLAARRARLPVDVLQVANSPFLALSRRIAAIEPEMKPRFMVTHGVFGVDGALERLTLLAKRDTATAERIAALGYDGPPARAVSNLLLDFAFAANPGGVVLTSAYGSGHLAGNAAAASRAPDPRLVPTVEGLLTLAEAAASRQGTKHLAEVRAETR